MVFVFDLDHTLLDTEKLWRSFMNSVLRPYRINWVEFERARELTRKKGPVTPRNIFRTLFLVTKKKFGKSIEEQSLNYVRRNAHYFYYPDVFRVIPKLPGGKILITRGDKMLQGSKVCRKSFRRLFDRIYITSNLKAGTLRRVAARNKGQLLVFVDDRPEEHKAALRLPSVLSIHLLRSNTSHKPLVHSRCFVVKNLEQLRRLLPKLGRMEKDEQRKK